MKKLFLLFMLTIGMIVHAQTVANITANAWKTIDQGHEKEINDIIYLTLSVEDLFIDDVHSKVFDMGEEIISGQTYYYFGAIDQDGYKVYFYLNKENAYGFISFPDHHFVILIELLKWQTTTN